MRTYLQALIPFAKYLLLSKGIDWTDDILDVVEYLRVAASRPCCPSYPKKFFQALCWFMKIGEWKGQRILSESALVSKAVDFWTEALSAQVHPLKQAARVPWVIMASMELYICNDQHPRMLRYKAFTVMLKSVGTLREDDIQHLAGRKLRRVGSLIVGVLMKSKTTGAAKRIRELPFAVHCDWTLTRSMWIENGLAMMEDLLPPDADFLLPRFGKGGEPKAEPITYTGSAALTARLFADLRVPIYCTDKNQWDEGTDRLLPGQLTTFWTEHGPRAVIPTASQALGAPKDLRDNLGRWSPSGSDDYSRTYRTAVGELQMLVLRGVLSQDRRLSEDDIGDRILQSAEYGLATAAKAEEMNRSFRSMVANFDVQLKRAGGMTDPDEELSAIQPVLQPPVQQTTGQPVVQRKQVPVGGCSDGFLIVYTRKRKSAKLHKLGGCEWTQVTLNDSLVVKSVNPEMYSSRCKLCFPKALVSCDDVGQAMSDSELSDL